MSRTSSDGRLREDVLQRLEQRHRVTSFDAGSAIHFHGDAGATIGVVLTGEVTFSRTSERGEKIPVGRIARGEVYGVYATMTGIPRTQDAHAIGKTRIIALNRKVFRQLLATDADFQDDIILFLSRRLEHTIARFQDSARMSLKARMAVLLLHLCREEQGAINVTHSELALQLAVSRNAVGTALAELDALGLVRRGYRNIEMTSRKRLSAWLRSLG